MKHGGTTAQQDPPPLSARLTSPPVFPVFPALCLHCDAERLIKAERGPAVSSRLRAAPSHAQRGDTHYYK